MDEMGLYMFKALVIIPECAESLIIVDISGTEGSYHGCS